MGICTFIYLLVSLSLSSAHVCKRVNRTHFSPYGPHMCHEFCQCYDSHSDYDITGLMCGCKTTINRSLKLDICSNKRGTVDRVMQMRCVMCTDIPGCTVQEQFCQDVQGHIVCSLISNNRSCVLTTNVSGPRLNPKNTTDEHDLKPGDVLLVKHKANCLKSQQIQSSGRQEIIREIIRCRSSYKYHCSDKHQVKRVQDLYLSGNESINCVRSGRYPDTPVIMLMRCGRDVFDLVVGLGADLSVKLRNSANLLFVAIHGKFVYPVNVLFALGFDTEFKGGSRPSRRTPFQEAVLFGSTTMMEYLASAGCNINVVKANQQNVLHMACKHGRREMVKHLLKLNFTFKLDDCDKYGKTPLDYARRKTKKMKGVIELLEAATKANQ